MAYSWDRFYQRSDNDTGYAAAKSDTFDIAAGLEYASTSRLWSITLEAANKYLFKLEENLINNERNRSAVTTIISKQLLNETLNIEYTFLAQLQSNDVFQKLKAEYALTDNITGIMELGGFMSQNEDGPYWRYRNKERVFFGIKLQI
jgi:hypothetical protein